MNDRVINLLYLLIENLIIIEFQQNNAWFI